MSGHGPEAPPDRTELEQLREDNAALRTMIERARWALLGDQSAAEDRLREAEIGRAVAEHQVEAYRNQAAALVRELQRVYAEGVDEGLRLIVVTGEPLDDSPGADYEQGLRADAERELATSESASDRLRVDRARLHDTLAAVLKEFIYETHPGRACLQSRHVDVAIVEEWRTVLQEVPR
ncbi:hypothetical protein [Streptomyces sp. NPDC096153]|uniref:hypothetical protein n=1 Tax=Streptomyces sp. NPDC096153 TaxID=3155548 RepID=UPI0033245D03